MPPKLEIGYALSGRSACKLCGQLIKQYELRIARLEQSTHFDGYQHCWHHIDCLFDVPPANGIAQKAIDLSWIAGIDKLSRHDRNHLTRLCTDVPAEDEAAIDTCIIRHPTRTQIKELAQVYAAAEAASADDVLLTKLLSQLSPNQLPALLRALRDLR